MAAKAYVSIVYGEAAYQELEASDTYTMYTITRSDSLWTIAKTLLGDGNRYQEIYDYNADILERAARQHGRDSSENGTYLYYGTEIRIPGTLKTSVRTVTRQPDGEDISKRVTSFSYTDEMQSKSDSISVSISNIDKAWLGSRMPKRGSTLGAFIKTTDWGKGSSAFNCGTFVLDDISFSGRPLTCTLNAVSMPADSDFKTKKRTVVWRKSSLSDVASKIAGAYGLALFFSGEDITVTDLEQTKQTDSAFLAELCDRYDYSVKVYNHKLVVFATRDAELADAVATIDESDTDSWTYNTTTEGTYTGIELTYTNPDSSTTERTISVEVGESGRIYYANAQASSKYDAELQAMALLNKANRSIETMTVKMRADNSIVAGQCVYMTGFGNANGKYYIEQIKHSVGSGYKMQLTMHKVQSVTDEEQIIRRSSQSAQSAKTASSGGKKILPSIGG